MIRKVKIAAAIEALKRDYDLTVADLAAYEVLQTMERFKQERLKDDPKDDPFEVWKDAQDRILEDAEARAKDLIEDALMLDAAERVAIFWEGRGK